MMYEYDAHTKSQGLWVKKWRWKELKLRNEKKKLETQTESSAINVGLKTKAIKWATTLTIFDCFSEFLTMVHGLVEGIQIFDTCKSSK